MDSTELSRIRFDKTVAKAQIGNYEYVKEQVDRWGVGVLCRGYPADTSELEGVDYLPPEELSEVFMRIESTRLKNGQIQLLDAALQGKNTRLITYLVEKKILSNISDKGVLEYIRSKLSIPSLKAEGLQLYDLSRGINNPSLSDSIAASLVKLNAVDDQGNSLLHYIIQKLSGIETLDQLFKNGAETYINRTNTEGHSPLCLCLLKKNAEAFGEKALIDIVTSLIDHGADVDLGNGSRPLHYAAHLSFSGPLKLLIDKGAKVNLQDSHGYTALHLAADLDKPIEASSLRREHCIILLAAGADINLPTKQGVTLLRSEILRCRKGNTDNIGFVLSKGAVVTDDDLEESKRRSKGLFNFYGKKVFQLISQSYKTKKDLGRIER